MKITAQKDKTNAVSVVKNLAPHLFSLLGAVKPDFAPETNLAGFALAVLNIRAYLARDRLAELEDFLAKNHGRITKQFSENETVRVLVWNLIERYLAENSKAKRKMILNAIKKSADQELLTHTDWHSRLEIVLGQIDIKEAEFLADIHSKELVLHQKGINYRDLELDFPRLNMSKDEKNDWINRIFSLHSYGLIVALEQQVNVVKEFEEMNRSSHAGAHPSGEKERKVPSVRTTEFGRFFVNEIMTEETETA